MNRNIMKSVPLIGKMSNDPKISIKTKLPLQVQEMLWENSQKI